MTATNDCGHSRELGIAGSETGTMCYPCAEALERAAFARASTFAGYVTGQLPRRFTTWTGAQLATVTSYRLGPWRYTPTGGGYRMRYVRAEAPDGSVWHGQGSDDYDLITLRRSRPASRVRAGREEGDAPWRA